MSLPVFFEIKKSSPCQTIKTFSLCGAHNLDEALLWIWRDLFLSILANEESSDRNSITPMLQDIEELMGWCGVMRVLAGGNHCKCLSFQFFFLSFPVLFCGINYSHLSI
jgi:hypothetical protein